MQDPAIKIHLLLGKKTVTEDLRQTLELNAVLLATGSHKTSARTFWGSRSPPTGPRDQRQPACWSYGEPGYFPGNCSYGREAENDDRCRKRDERPPRHTGTTNMVKMVTAKKQRGGQEGCTNIGKRVGAGEKGRTSAYTLRPPPSAVITERVDPVLTRVGRDRRHRGYMTVAWTDTATGWPERQLNQRYTL
jgi:hypothetical protein